MDRCSALAVALLLGLYGGVGARGFQTAQLPAKVSCAVDRNPPGEADRALYARRFDDAERLYGEALKADPKSSAAMAGLVRTAIGEGKLPEALAMANGYNTAHPNNPLLMDALGDVHFRRGEVDEAANLFNASMQLNICLAITRYESFRFLHLSGMFASAQKQLDLAHNLAPDDPEIGRRWRQSHAVPATAEQRLANLKDRLESPSLTDEQKEGIDAAIKGIENREKGDCELVTPVQQAKMPIVPLTGGASIAPDAMRAAGLEVSFNGKKRRMEIDTGASGLLLTKSVAKAAGLVPELETKIGGIGDKGPAATYVTHVDDIRIGNMEFHNCRVGVLEQASALEVDGLIGPDVFRDFVVTLDIPGRELRLSPLPRRPDEAATASAALDTGDDDQPQSEAERARDRYVAPEMKDWTPVYRYTHLLIFRTTIANQKDKLFLMDTGASRGMITPAAAREVTHVSSDDDMHIKGVSGAVKNVMQADNVTITFARVRQTLNGLSSFDSASLGRGSGVEISGIIGFPTLRELVISIDYRDDLVKVIYDPGKGFHLH